MVIDFWNQLIPQVKMVFITVLFISILSIIIAIKARKTDPRHPSTGIVFIAEILVDGVNNFTKDIFGRRYKPFAPYILTIALYIGINMFLGLFALPTPISSIWVCAGLGVTTFIWVHVTGATSNGVFNYIKSFAYTEKLFKKLPWIVNLPFVLLANCALIPFNLIGEIALPISLSLRLFGNVLSGAILLMLVYGCIDIFIDAFGGFGYIGLVIPPVFHAVFDIFFGLIQVYVFMILSAIFISLKLPEEENV